MNPANAAPDPLPPLGLSWGIKRSFVDYIASLPDELPPGWRDIRGISLRA